MFIRSVRWSKSCRFAGSKYIVLVLASDVYPSSITLIHLLKPWKAGIRIWKSNDSPYVHTVYTLKSSSFKNCTSACEAMPVASRVVNSIVGDVHSAKFDFRFQCDWKPDSFIKNLHFHRECAPTGARAACYDLWYLDTLFPSFLYTNVHIRGKTGFEYVFCTEGWL